jgi:hypothetical protein
MSRVVSLFPLALPDDKEDPLVRRMLLRALESEGAGEHFTWDEIDASLAHAIAAVETQLRPAGNDLAVQAVDVCVEVLAARRPPPPVLAVYGSLLGELPADLLKKAVRVALGSTTWHKLPPPGSFVSAVAGEWRARKERLLLLQRHANRIGVARLRDRTRFFP